MKKIKITLLFLLIAFSAALFAQTDIDKYEYFIDTDPGVGNGTVVAVSSPAASVSLSEPVSTTALSEGFHQLYFRAHFDNGIWGNTSRRLFYVLNPSLPNTPAPKNIVAAEYFIDTDPGVGSGTSISVTSGTNYSGVFTVSTTGLAADFHWLYVRAQFDDGTWGNVSRRLFYVLDPAIPNTPAPKNIVSAEYFIDTDPGVGYGTTISVTSGTDYAGAFTVPTTGQSAGFHYLYVRSQFDDGSWGNTSRRFFYVLDPAIPNTPAPQNIVAAEYFLDTDPGVGNATPVPNFSPDTTLDFTPMAIPLDCIDTGDYWFYLRGQFEDGSWGMVDSGFFHVEPMNGRVTSISAVEVSCISPPKHDISVLIRNIGDIYIPAGVALIELKASGANAGILDTIYNDIDIPAKTNYTLTLADFPLPNAGSTTITATMTLKTDLTTTNDVKTFTFDVVVDVTPPIVTCPSNLTVNTDPGECFWTVSSPGTASATDDCAMDTITNDLTTQIIPGIHTFTYTAVDVNSNMATCTQSIQVIDAENPMITCPADITVSTDAGLCTASGLSLGPAITSDNCMIASTGNDVTMGVYAQGANTVTWTTTDVHSNTADCAQTITVIDTEDPIIACPADITVSTDPGLCTAVATLGSPSVSDNCAIDNTMNDAPGTGIYPHGATSVTWTTEDTNTNTAECTQTVTVVDTEDPMITCPADVTVSTDAGLCTAAVTIGSATVSDNCAIDNTTNNAPGTGIYPQGMTSVTWTTEDTNTNTAECIQTVTVEDNEAPTIACPSDMTVSTDAGLCTAAISIGSPTVSDNCAIDNTMNNAPSSDIYPQGTTFVTWTTEDTNTNTADCVQSVTVEDTEAPMIACPADVSVSTDIGLCTATIALGSPTVSDNCAIDNTTNDAPGTGVYPKGITVVVWITEDTNNNTSECNQQVTVEDTENPLAICQNHTAYIDASGAQTITTSDIDDGSSDNCGIASIGISPNIVDCADVGTPFNITLTMTDSSNNTSNCIGIVTVLDTLGPIISCPADIVYSNDPELCGTFVDAANGVILGENCGIQSSTLDTVGVFDVGINQITYSALDVNGNLATCSFNITVEDVEPPIAVCPSDTVFQIMIGGSCMPSISFDISSMDNCPGSLVTSIPVSGSAFSVGTTLVSVTATDNAGLTDNCTFIVIVNANTEICNGIDDNCDGNVDEGVTTDYYPDLDMDGFGDENGTPIAACSAPSGYVIDNTDCDDSNMTVYPGAVEICDDGIDNNCDGNVDEVVCACETLLTGVNAVVMDSTKVAIGWDASPTAGFFKIQYRVKGTNGWTLLNIPNKSFQRVAWIISNLTKNTTYQYRVRQQCPNFNPGPYSSIQEFTTFTNSTCAIPDDSMISYLIDPTKVRLFIDYEPDALKYNVRWRVMGTAGPISSSIFKKGFTVISGLSAATTYEYRIRSLCGSTWTGYSAWKPFTTNAIPPLAPRDFSFSNEENVKNEVLLYPNPTENVLQILTKSEDEKQLRVLDFSGKIIMDRQFQSELEQIDLSSIPAGTYLIQVFFENGEVVVEKVVKM